MDVLYTAIAHASGGGRDGRVLSEDNRIDMDTRVPKEMGGTGEGTNPEQLFAAGYSACYLSAIHGVGRHLKLDTKDAGVSASVSIGKTGEIAYGLAVELDVYLPNVPADRRQEVVDLADKTCPYSNATRGNVEVKLTIVD
jgi:osmotically inducible protein OsmC